MSHALVPGNPAVASGDRVLPALGLGYLFGKIALGSFKLGAVTGTLLAGVLVGQLGVTLPNEVKQCFFLLFLFAIGFRTGPQFFRGLKSDGLAHAALAAIVATTGLVVAWVVAVLFGYDAGTAAGLVAGALTESATIGTAMDAIARLDLSGGRADGAQQQHPGRLRGHLSGRRHGRRVGVVAARAEAAAGGYRRRVPQARGRDGRDRRRPGRHLCLQAIRRPGLHAAGEPGGRVGGGAGGQVRAPARLRGAHPPGSELLDAGPAFVLQAGDRLALTGRSEVLVGEGNPLRGAEVDDEELLDIPAVEVDVVVTRRDLAGRPLGRLAEAVDREVATRGVFVCKLTRAGQELPRARGTVVERGDLITLVGTKADVQRVAERVGMPQWASPVTDLPIVAAAIAVGGLLGVASVKIGGLDVGLSLAVGVLLGGLVVGWLHSVTPGRGRVPDAALWVCDSLGLTGFLAVVGLNAGPEFVRGLRESGVVLLASGVLLGALPHVLTILVGRYLFRLHPGVLLGDLRRGGTSLRRAGRGSGRRPQQDPHAGVRRQLRGRQRAAGALGLGRRGGLLA